MAQIFVNLKRFEVSRRVGGLCPVDDPQAWIAGVMDQTVALGLGRLPQTALTYLLPEGLLATAARALAEYPPAERQGIALGCQGVHWDDIRPGGNFGAFTSSRPAQAAVALGCRWAIIGHSEERRAGLQVLASYDAAVLHDAAAYARAAAAIDRLIQAEVQCALRAGLDVLLCIGETAEERGAGPWEEQQPRIERVLGAQLATGLEGAAAFLPERQVVIGYEPVWAIGPGKTPPGREYIAFVSALVKRIVQGASGFDPLVVYGGGLKEENAAMIGGIESVGGGLVALTRFSGQIGFDVGDLARIVERYRSGAGRQER